MDAHGWIALRSSDHRTVAQVVSQLPSETRANAALIVRAVNAHEALVAALEACMFALGRGGANTLTGPNRAEWESARAALALAMAVR